MSFTTAQAHEHAVWLSQQYSPWCLLHMLLKNHSELFSTALLEELLPPHTPYLPISFTSPASPSTCSSPSSLSSTSFSPSASSSIASRSHSSTFAQSTQFAQQQDQESPNPSSALRPKAYLSRYLVQRLHFGYYGNRSTLPESAVRYLTARARLEFGYFIIRGRAFWHVLPEDLEEHQDIDAQDPAGFEGNGQEAKPGAKAEGLQDQHSRRARAQQRPHRQRPQQGQQMQAQVDDNDPGGNKDEDPNALVFSETSAIIGRRRGGAGAAGRARLNSQEEQRERIVNGNQRCEEREEQLLMAEAVRYLERQHSKLIVDLLVDLTQVPLKPPFSPNPDLSTAATSTELSERQVAAIYWRRVALTKLIDSQAEMDTDILARIPSSPFLNRRADCFWMDRLQRPPTVSMTLKDLKTQSQPHGGMRMVQDDARLFQIASGVFDGLAMHPKKWGRSVRSIIDGPRLYSPSIVESLVVEYGYMPLPEDDADRKMHYKGGCRAMTGEPDVFPSDGSHVINRQGLKGQGTSIWYFYNLQHTEVMVAFLMHRAPVVLDWLFEQGFELKPRSGLRCPGISRVLLLQCCIPGCHAMVRHVYQQSTASPVMSSSVAVRTMKTELLGYGNKPKRIEFRQEDFAEVLKGVPLSHLRETLDIMRDLGMESYIVQNRLMEQLQIPGGPAPVDVEKVKLTVLFANCVQNFKSSASDTMLAATDIVNLALQQSFEIQMDSSGVFDREWKHTFEDTLLSLRRERLIVHSHVSAWIQESLDPAQAAFRICFDHVILDTLLGITEWNVAQVKRLQKWTRLQEREARMKSTRTGRQWEQIKRRLVFVQDKDVDGKDDLMRSVGEQRRIGLNIEWTTNDQITMLPSGIVASLPKGSEMVRISDDGYLLLDNGCLAQGLLLCNQLVEGDAVLDTNSRVDEFLRKGANVEEKHWIWLAMGLVTVSLQGPRVAEIPLSESSAAGNRSIRIKMACSPEAYQLVWLLALTFVRQSAFSEEDMAAYEASAKEDLDAMDQGSDYHPGHGNPLSPPHRSPSSALVSGSVSPPLSPVPLSSCGARVRALQRHLYSRLGVDAWLLIDILTEIESEIEEQLAYERELDRQPDAADRSYGE
ncbi:hypothetical protein BC939DRAFT_464578 [Gamsiella multidivaricata]|uniref:uncharacterized protein n=1 Tax=Gamsiella multidivaricata TaxID=101098 RepID=UPI0022208D52|nr:uncharacterized protein BC939DRAFT_464578 [Gamsiella multidivaricata]KAG0362138.1 hypothetical protein BGZ54_008766 [Gamsiella multidivaricata]KAI7817841.1 hypothetical protein BC939DRAFT_464578 [Gamsiella multidivaricata]